jgi:acetyl-CoA synthetase
MLPEGSSYDELRRRFSWRVPARFNIAVACADRWAEAAPDNVAVVERGEDGARSHLTFAALREASCRFAHALRDAGIGRGDRVALLLPQCSETAIAHLAVYRLGAIVVPLSLMFGDDALEYRLNDSSASALVTLAAGVTKLARIRARVPGLKAVFSVDGPDGAVLGFHEESATRPPILEPVDTQADDPAMMIYTSGTTGPPKGALHGHRVLLGHLPGVQMAHEFLPRPGDLMWTPADWAWAGGLLNVLLPGLYFGLPVFASRFAKFDPELAFSVMAEFSVRNAFVPPTALRMMRGVRNPRGRWPLDLRTLASGGESLGREVYEWGREALGLTINEFYGQTECNFVLSSCAALGVSKPGAIGRAVPGHEVALIDGQGRVLPAGEVGQIAIRHPDPVMFLEYWNRPDATADKFVAGWMTTGDQGVADADGYISFIGRDDDVITSSGYRIGPGEIEDCLISHPAVALAAVIGKPDPLRTEIVMAFVVPAEGVVADDALVADIQAFVRERLSAHEYPREIAFIEEMPLTTTGKIIRRQLREWA